MRLTSAEAASYEQNGFLVREGAFSADEITEINRACEQTCTAVTARSVEKARVQVSQYYVFERDVADSELDFERNEIDPDRLDTSGMIVVEVPAGSVMDA